MNAEQLFLEHIAKIKKRALWRAMQQGLLVAFVLFLLATAFTTGLEKTGVLRIREAPVFYGVILGIALDYRLHVYADDETAFSGSADRHRPTFAFTRPAQHSL